MIGFLISDVPRMIVNTSWPTTHGTIISNRIVGVKINDWLGGSYAQFNVYIRYDYTVAGVEYSSMAINTIDSTGYHSDFADRYPKGIDVLVYFNPRDPSDAILEPGFVDLPEAFDFFSYLAFGAGVFFIYIGISRFRKARKKTHLNQVL